VRLLLRKGSVAYDRRRKLSLRSAVYHRPSRRHHPERIAGAGRLRSNAGSTTKTQRLCWLCWPRKLVLPATS
jgi:hypothetical protein